MAKNHNKRLNSNIETVYEACKKVIAENGYNIINSSKSDFTLSFNTGRSMSSWHGQDLTVTLFREGENTEAVVGGSIAKGGSAITGGGSQVFSWGEKDKLSKKFLELVERILPKIQVVASATEVAKSSDAGIADEIKSLFALKEAGALSEEEFAAAKSKLLSKS